MARKLAVRTKELGRAQDRAEQAGSKLESLNDKLRKADTMMAGVQFRLEDRTRLDSRYKKQLGQLQAKLNNAEQRFARDEATLLNIKARVELIGERRRKEEEKKKKKSNNLNKIL